MSSVSYDNNTFKRSFSVCHLNIRSILSTSDGGPSRFDLLCDFVTKQNDFEVIALTETHIDNSVDSSLIEIEGYHLFRKDRNRAGGGVVLYVRSSLNPKLLFNTDTYSSESIFVKAHIGNKSVTVGVCYRPPNQSSSDREDF